MKKFKRDIEHFKETIIGGLKDLKKFYLCEFSSYMGRYNYIRSVIAPTDYIDDFKDYYKGDYEDREIDYSIYDPTIPNICERSVSGMGTYHMNPRDTYFDIQDLFFKKEEEKNTTDLAKALQDMTQDIHKLGQLPLNFIENLKMMRDKMYFGIGGKVIESEGTTLPAEIVHYSPEELAIGSSNGKKYDIFGVKEELSLFSFKTRFDIGKEHPFQSEHFMKRVGMGLMEEGGEAIVCYRICIQRDVIIRHMEEKCSADPGTSDYKRYKKLIMHLFPKEKQNPWIDMWFNDYGLISVRSLAYQNIIVSQWGPSHRTLGIGKGQGDKCIPLAMIIAEIADISYTGFERTYAAPYVIPSNKTLFGSDFGRDGIIVANAASGKGMPTILSANVDIRGAAEFWEYNIEKFKKLWFLDVFELVHKNRMTTVEVNRREQDDYRRLLIFVQQDEATNLNPEVVAMKHILHEYYGKDDVLSNRVILARYTSPLSYAHRNSVFEKTDKLNESLAMMGQTLEKFPALREVLSWKGQVKKLVKGSEELDYLLSDEEQQAQEQMREDSEQSELDLKRGQAEGQALDNAKRYEEVVGGQKDQRNLPPQRGPQPPTAGGQGGGSTI